MIIVCIDYVCMYTNPKSELILGQKHTLRKYAKHMEMLCEVHGPVAHAK